MRNGTSSIAAHVAAAAGIAALALGLLASAASASPVFSKLSGQMSEARDMPAAALLPNGKVLIAGGYREGTTSKTAELFDPATGTFSKLSAELTTTRGEAAFVALPGGNVLIAGGYNLVGKNLRSAELFNAETGAFEKLAAEMTVERDAPAAALLSNGKVLIVGGASEAKTTKSAELYNPATRTFETMSAEMGEERYGPAVGTLPSGKVLVAGGYNATAKYLKSTELFNPQTNAFEKLEGPAHELTEPRDEAGFTTLANGKVLIAGGYNEANKDLSSAELFNPETNTFESLTAELTEARSGPVAVLLPGGKVLIAGGYDEAGKYLASAEETSVTPPTVATAAASSVGVTSATLSGTVVGETASNTYFQYGTNTAYGSSTAQQSAAASIGPLPVSAAVSGLSPSTVYHFRIVAENAGGPSYGLDQTFVTVAAPPVPPPSIGKATQSHRKWRAGSALAKISRKAKGAPVGTSFGFTLNEQATVSFAFTQQVGGRKVRGRCVAQTRTNRAKRTCKRTVTRGTLSFTGHAGANRVSFQGRISRSNKLRPGTYTLVITAKNSLGMRSSPTRLTFTIVK